MRRKRSASRFRTVFGTWATVKALIFPDAPNKNAVTISRTGQDQPTAR